MRVLVVAAVLATALLVSGCTAHHGAAQVTCQQYKDYLIVSIDFPQGALDTAAFSHLTTTDQASVQKARDAFRVQWFGFPSGQVTDPSLNALGLGGTYAGQAPASASEQQALLANWTTWASMAEQDMLAMRGC